MSEDSTLIKQSEMVSRQAIRDVHISNMFAWRDSSKKSAEGARVRKVLYETDKGAIGREIRNQIIRSAENTSSILRRTSDSLKKEMSIAREKGATEQGCLNILRYRFPLLISKRIKLIARSDPHFASSALTKARSEDLGISCFIWTTRHDNLVRHAHDNLDGVVVFWNDLPSPENLVGMGPILGYYGPGESYNCRCVAVPIFSFNDLFTSDRSRISVYHEGRIQQMTKSRFMELV